MMLPGIPTNESRGETSAEPTESCERPLRRWPLILLLLVLTFGAIAGALMTWHHETQLYGEGGHLVGCSESMSASCDEVNTSSWSEVFGVPLATWAIATYVTFGVLAVLALRGRRAAASLLLIGGAAVTAFSVFLLYVALSQVGFLCSWCFRLYIVNAATFLLATAASGPARPDRGTLLRAFAIFAGVALLSISVQRLFRRQLIGDTTRVAEKPSEPVTVERDPFAPAPGRTIDVTSEDDKTGAIVIAPRDAWKGNPKAKVTLVEFADFQCGHCRSASAALSKVFETYGDRVQFVFKHYPLDPMCNPGVENLKHALGCSAARAAVCAREQGKFWAFHDLAFANQRDLSIETLRILAERAGVELSEFDACAADPRSLEAVRADGELGKALGLHGTPRIFIGDALYRGGRSPEAFARAIDAALAGAGQ